MLKSTIFFGAMLGCVMAGPSLSVLKELDSEDAVAGRNLTVTVTIYNLGDSAAHEVELDDAQYTNIDNSVAAKTWDTIAPGASEKYSHVVTPSKAGLIMYVPPAKVTYKADSGSTEVKVAFSNYVYDTTSADAVDGLAVITQAAFDRKASRRVTEWLSFLLLLLIPVGMPFFFYQTSTNSLKTKRATIKKNTEEARASSVRKASPARKSSPGRK